MYKDNRTWRLQRDFVMVLAFNICEDCGKEARMVHHKDGTKSNHSLYNLKALCYSCHRKYHPIKFKHGKRKIKRKIEVDTICQEQIGLDPDFDLVNMVMSNSSRFNRVDEKKASKILQAKGGLEWFRKIKEKQIL